MNTNDGATIARPPQGGADLRGYVNEFGDEVQPEVIEDMQRFYRDPEAYFRRFQSYVETAPTFAMVPRPRGGGGSHDSRKPITNPAEFPTVLNSPQDQERMHQAHNNLQNFFYDEWFRFRSENRDLLDAAGFSKDTVNDVEERCTEVFGAMEDFFHHEQLVDISMFHGNFDAHLEHARVQANAISAALAFQDIQRLQNAAREHIGKHGAGNEADFARRFVNNMRQIQNAHLERQKTFNEDPHKGLEFMKDRPASMKAMGRLPRELQSGIQDHSSQAAQYKRKLDKEFRAGQGDWGNPSFIADRQQAFSDRIKQNQEAERLAMQAAAEASRETAARMAKERRQAETRDRRRQRELERMFPDVFGKGNNPSKDPHAKTGGPDADLKSQQARDRKGLFGGVKNGASNVMNRFGGGLQWKPEQNAEAAKKKAEADKAAAAKQEALDRTRRSQQGRQQATENDRQNRAREKRESDIDTHNRQNKGKSIGQKTERASNQNPDSRLGGGQQQQPVQTARNETSRDNGKDRNQTPARTNGGNNTPVNGKSSEQRKGPNPALKPSDLPVRPDSNVNRTKGQTGTRPQQNEGGTRKVPPKSYGYPNVAKNGGARNLAGNADVQDTLAKVRAQQAKMREQAQRIAQQARQLGQNIQQRARRVIEGARKFPERVRNAYQDAQNRLNLNGRQTENKLGNLTKAQVARPIQSVVKTNQPRNAGSGLNLSKGSPNNAHRVQPVRKALRTGGIRGAGGGAAPASRSVGQSNTPPLGGPKPPSVGGNVAAPKRPVGNASPSASPRPPIKLSSGNAPGPRVQTSSGNNQNTLNPPKSSTPVIAGGGEKRPIASRALTSPPNNISLPGSGGSGLKPIRSIGPTPPTGTRLSPPAVTPGGRKPAITAPPSGLKPPAPPAAGVKPPKPLSSPGTVGPKPSGGGMKIGGGRGGR